MGGDKSEKGKGEKKGKKSATQCAKSSRSLHTILEGAFSKLSSFFFELFDCSLINTTALVDQVSSGGGFSGIDVSDDCDSHISDHITSFSLFSAV